MSLISQRGKEYLETAQTLLRTARTMTDQHVAGQLKALAEDYERRAEKASHADRAKALARSAARVDRDDQAYEPEVPIKVQEWMARLPEGGRRPQCGDPGGDRPDPQRSGQDRHNGGHATGRRVATHPMRSGATAASDVELDRQCHPVDEWR